MEIHLDAIVVEYDELLIRIDRELHKNDKASALQRDQFQTVPPTLINSTTSVTESFGILLTNDDTPPMMILSKSAAKFRIKRAEGKRGREGGA